MHVLPFGGKELIFIEEKILNKKSRQLSTFYVRLRLTTDVLLRKSRGGSASQGTPLHVLLFSGKVMYRDVNYELIQYREKDKKKAGSFLLSR